MSAVEILTKAAGHMHDRASTYDKPEGERSMAQTVAIFNLYHGTDLTEAEGWHLLQIMKDVRLFTRPGYHADSAEDCVAYAALKAEALSHAGVIARALGNRQAVEFDAVAAAEVSAAMGWPDETRRQGAAAEDEAWKAIEARQPRIDSGPMWVEWRGESTDAPCHSEQWIEVELRDGDLDKGRAGGFRWIHQDDDGDIVAWRTPFHDEQPYAGHGGVMIQCPGCTAQSCECRP